MIGDLLRERLVASNRQHAITAIFEGLPSPPILIPLRVFVVLGPVDEHADTRDLTSAVVKIGLYEHIRSRGVLSEIRKLQLLLV